MKSTTARGYGNAHQLARKKWKPIVEAGEAFCTRCGGHIAPAAHWHLDHSEDRARYLGAAHARCNQLAGARKGGRIQARKAQQRKVYAQPSRVAVPPASDPRMPPPPTASELEIERQGWAPAWHRTWR